MQKVISVEAMRAIDRLSAERYRLPSLLLMESAARESLRVISERLPGELSEIKVTILCGPGNNGGDGAALARLLADRGAGVHVALLGAVEDTKGDARINFDILTSLPGMEFSSCAEETALENFFQRRGNDDLYIDALFGTGLTRPLAGLFSRAVEFLNHLNQSRRRRALIVSLDVPSGLNADHAELIGPAVNANLTITFTAPKLANVMPPAAASNGELKIVSVGSPAALIEEAPSQLSINEASEAIRWLQRTRYAAGSFKNSHGHALIVAGSRQYTGAAILAANAAMRSGAGLVTLAAPASSLPLITPRLLPEVMSFHLEETEHGAISEAAFDRLAPLVARVDAIAVGPGLTSQEETTRNFVKRLVSQNQKPLVIDADGLNSLAPWPETTFGGDRAPLIITPHLGEMRRLLDLSKEESITDRVAAARDFSISRRVTTVLKGARMLIASPDGQVTINPSGNPGAGTAGAGDTLTGIITGFLAQAKASSDGPEVADTVRAAVYLAGTAADLAARERGMRAMTASDIREFLPSAIRKLDPEGEMP